LVCSGSTACTAAGHPFWLFLLAGAGQWLLSLAWVIFVLRSVRCAFMTLNKSAARPVPCSGIASAQRSVDAESACHIAVIACDYDGEYCDRSACGICSTGRPQRQGAWLAAAEWPQTRSLLAADFTVVVVDDHCLGSPRRESRVFRSYGHVCEAGQVARSPGDDRDGVALR